MSGLRRRWNESHDAYCTRMGVVLLLFFSSLGFCFCGATCLYSDKQSADTAMILSGVSEDGMLWVGSIERPDWGDVGP